MKAMTTLRKRETLLSHSLILHIKINFEWFKGVNILKPVITENVEKAKMILSLQGREENN